ncbi:AMP-binding protein [Comamonadaceae bacterium G21597-S1]|nr:AMP-binding protein [Comamonadaceae bacterium G21597-S1]
MLTGDMLRRSAERFPHKAAVIRDAARLSYAELDAAANRFARALLQLGLPKGAKVAIVSRNLPEYAVAFFGTARSGLVLVNVSVLYAPDELAWVLHKADTRVLLFDAMFAQKLAQVLPQCPAIAHVVRIDSPEAADGAHAAWPADLPSPRGFDGFLAGHAADDPGVALDENDAFCMTYTGGTTGRPKGVLCSHRARAVTAHTVVVEEALDERDVVAIVTPMFHVAALNIMFQPAMLVGATVTFVTPWSPEKFMATCKRDAVTAAFMVPTQANTLVTHAAFDAAALASWRKLSFAGAPMPDWVQLELQKKLPNLLLTQIYGQSEMGVLTALRHWNLAQHLGSIGRQAFNVDIGLFDQQGAPVAPGELGEIASRGDNLMLAYYNEPEQTAAFYKFPDRLPGWGFTGDVGTIDADGFVTLVDRAKDMLISGGENVYPKEIEDVLYQLPQVAECAVFGVPDAKFGELPAAFLLLKPGASLDEAQVLAHVEAHLARHKRPRLIRFVTEFPKTPIGKIQKNILKQPFWQGRTKKL